MYVESPTMEIALSDLLKNFKAAVPADYFINLSLIYVSFKIVQNTQY